MTLGCHQEPTSRHDSPAGAEGARKQPGFFTRLDPRDARGQTIAEYVGLVSVIAVAMFALFAAFLLPITRAIAALAEHLALYLTS